MPNWRSRTMPYWRTFLCHIGVVWTMPYWRSLYVLCHIGVCQIGVVWGYLFLRRKKKLEKKIPAEAGKKS